jgi:DNA-binding PadR family transcriptional regulator
MEQISSSAEGLEEKMKKATCEMLVLFLFEKQAMYVNEVAAELARRSGKVFAVSFPYAVIYRMERHGYVQLKDKHIAKDGRLRQFYEITDKGHTYLTELLISYDKMEKGISAILHSDGSKE